MKSNNLSVKIAYLYPESLNLYGDIGNIITLKNRCIWRGIEVDVTSINPGDSVSGYDIYFAGGGQDKQQEDIAKELYKNKDILTQERDNGAVFLGICGGYQLFGHYYQPHNKPKLLGLSLLDVYTIAGDKRFIGNVTVKTDFLNPQTLVGFENHSGLTFLQGETQPLGSSIIGAGNNGQDKFEGARYKNVFGTYLHGSLLPKNPHFADYLIKLALEKKYDNTFELDPLDDFLEMQTHNSLISKAY